MELEELKDIWQKGHQKLGETPQHSTAEIFDLLKKRTLGIMAKINRSILIEVVMTILVASLIIYLYWQSQAIVLTISVLSITSLIHYWIKYRILNNSKYLEGNLQAVLTRLATIFGRYMQGYYILMWTTFVIVNSAMIIDFIQSANKTKIGLGQIGIAFGLAITLNIGLFFILKKYLQILYGNHYQDLKNCLQELQSNDYE